MRAPARSIVRCPGRPGDSPGRRRRCHYFSAFRMLPPPVRRSAGIGIARAHLATLVAATRVYRAGGLKRPAIGGLVNCHRNPVLISVLFAASGALAQGMLLDFAADK